MIAFAHFHGVKLSPNTTVNLKLPYDECRVGKRFLGEC